jgi:hypothetical protein
MPLFPTKPAEPFNVKNLKLEEYKKQFGKRYSRVGVNTIQIERVQTSREDRDELFLEKKHLKELKGAEETQSHFRETTSRRLALPKLHGAYKVLDRYEGK